MRALSLRASPAVAPLLAIAGGGAIAIGAWLPWMSYFAGLFPLRGVIGLNGRLLLATGIVATLGGLALALTRKRSEPSAQVLTRRGLAVIGLLVVVASAWLLIGVRGLTHVTTSNAMLAPRAGIGLFVILAGGALLTCLAF